MPSENYPLRPLIAIRSEASVYIYRNNLAANNETKQHHRATKEAVTRNPAARYKCADMQGYRVTQRDRSPRGMREREMASYQSNFSIFRWRDFDLMISTIPRSGRNFDRLLECNPLSSTNNGTMVINGIIKIIVGIRESTFPRRGILKKKKKLSSV